MVFVTVGTQDKKFNRLIEYVLKLVEEKVITDKIIIQKGVSDIFIQDDMKEDLKKRNIVIEYFDFCDVSKMNKYIHDADYVITHAGVGTIIQCIRENKKTIVIPRIKKYGEHENDHQLEIAEKFNNLNYIICAKDYKSLKKAILDLPKMKFEKYVSTNDHFVDTLEKIIDEI